MSDFVNYNQRGINLPDGCKDLADVIRLKEAQSTPQWEAPLSQLKEFFERAARSRAVQYYLNAFPRTKPWCCFSVLVEKSSVKGVWFTTLKDSSEQKALGEFCVNFGITALETDPIAEKDHSEVFIAETSQCSVNYVIRPTPTDTSTLVALATNLLEQVCGVSEVDLLSMQCMAFV